MKRHSLVIMETHPVQYHAPVYRCLARDFGVEVNVVYGSDFSVAGYRDAEFGASFAWDTDLLGGVNSHFLSRVGEGGARDYSEVKATGLDQMMAGLKPDAVMALGYAHPFDRAGLKWAERNQKPTLFRGETSDHAHRRGLVKGVLRDLLLRRLYRRCRGLLYVGKRSREHYERLGVPERRLFFSPYCVDGANFHSSREDRAAMRKSAREHWGIPVEATVLLYSGKLSHRKGVDLMPEAVRLLPSALRQKVWLLFLGDGALKNDLVVACQRSPEVRATFTGFQNQSDLSALYHAADMLVLPSREKETWGLVVNEAMMHGLPCVVSDAVGSRPDLVLPGVTGEYFEQDGADALAQALERVLEMMETPNLDETCRAQVGAYSVAAAAEGIFHASKVATESR